MLQHTTQGRWASVLQHTTHCTQGRWAPGLQHTTHNTVHTGKVGTRAATHKEKVGTRAATHYKEGGHQGCNTLQRRWAPGLQHTTEKVGTRAATHNTQNSAHMKKCAGFAVTYILYIFHWNRVCSDLHFVHLSLEQGLQ